MSHKATNWLAEIDPHLLGASEFRVLFHLCDCHNASAGCFPSQAYLRDRAGVSNGTVNNVLNALEAKGLIVRRRGRDKRTKRQCQTRYILGFEMEKPQEPTPKSGDGSVSNSEADPTPIQGPTRLQPTGEEPVSNLEITCADARARLSPLRSCNQQVDSSVKRRIRDFRAGRLDAFVDAQVFEWQHLLWLAQLSEGELALVRSKRAENGGAV